MFHKFNLERSTIFLCILVPFSYNYPPPSTNFVNEDLTWLFKWTVIKVFNIHKTFFWVKRLKIAVWLIIVRIHNHSSSALCFNIVCSILQLYVMFEVLVFIVSCLVRIIFMYFNIYYYTDLCNSFGNSFGIRLVIISSHIKYHEQLLLIAE